MTCGPVRAFPPRRRTKKTAIISKEEFLATDIVDLFIGITK
jgi:hypothetical protein